MAVSGVRFERTEGIVCSAPQPNPHGSNGYRTDTHLRSKQVRPHSSSPSVPARTPPKKKKRNHVSLSLSSLGPLGAYDTIR